MHLGDCLVSLHFLNKLCESNPHIGCEFSCGEEYHSQLKELINPKNNIVLFPKMRGGKINLWCSNILFRVQDRDRSNYPFFTKRYPDLQDVCEMVFKSYELISLENNLVSPYKNKYDILFDEYIIESDLINEKYDVLLVNSDCLSGQVNFSGQQQIDIFANIIEKLKKHNKTFITTKKYQNYPSVQDKGLSIGKIGCLSNNCEMIIGVPTSPFWITLTKKNIEKKTKFINITQDACTYEFGDIVKTVRGDFNQIYYYTENLFILDLFSDILSI